MSGFIVSGQEENVEGLTVKNWKDDARLRIKFPEDGTKRTTSWIRSVVLHTTLGIPGGRDQRPQLVLPGLGPSTNAAVNINHFWSTNKAPGGAHLIVDFDGTIFCLADLATEVTYHATTMNHGSIGVEIVQRKADAALYEGQLERVVQLVDWLTARFSIQRQMHWPYASPRPVARLAAGGKDCVGIFAHFQNTMNRGSGDPGVRIFELLKDGGYESFDFSKNQDKAVWSQRQVALQINNDGIPGPLTVKELVKAGHANGLWVVR